jgi:hypothetical protein
VKTKDGRRNRYEVQTDLLLPGSVIRSATVGEVLAVLIGDRGAGRDVVVRSSPQVGHLKSSGRALSHQGP